MNPLGQPLVLKANFKRLGLLAAIGLILFFVFHISCYFITNHGYSVYIFYKQGTGNPIRTIICSLHSQLHPSFG